MPLQIVQGDITKVPCDAIVNAAKPSLLGGGGVDGAIHKAAGMGLFWACLTLGGCKVGEAKITKGYNLPARFVIHTVGPKWKNGQAGEREKLYSCYIRSLLLAKANGCQTVAFPLISAGDYGYPEDAAIQVAREAIESFLTREDMLVYLVLYNPGEKQVKKKKHTVLLWVIVLLAVLALLALIFRDYIVQAIWDILLPVAPPLRDPRY